MTQKTNVALGIIKCILLSFYFQPTLHAQKESENWHFGTHSAVSFSSNPPTVALSSIMVQEGCSSISDTAGNLLFYTAAGTVYDKTNSMVANGNGLLGNGSSTQSNGIVKQPGNNNTYYIFTMDHIADPNGLQYSVVDMNLAAGNGSVAIKNVLLHTPTTEKQSLVRHANGQDVWVVTHDYNSNSFRSYLLTAAGLNTVAVISSVGLVHSNSFAGSNTIGAMKVSKNGKKIAVAVYNPLYSFELFDFNNVNGTVSNGIVLGTNFPYAYGVEFSPDCTKLYGSLALVGTSGTIYQWNLCAGSSSAVISSSLIIGNAAYATGALQLAPDGKIYVARYQQSTIGIINNPNALGLASNYVDLGLNLGTSGSLWGLPTFVNDIAYPGGNLAIKGTSTVCEGESVTLSASGASTYSWSTSSNNSSITVSPPLTTTYTVTGTNSCVFSQTTFVVTVMICNDKNEMSINEAQEIQFYPNPSETKLFLKLQNEGSIHLIDSYGITVYVQNVEPGIQILDHSALPAGIYYLKFIEHEDKIPVTRKILIH